MFLLYNKSCGQYVLNFNQCISTIGFNSSIILFKNKASPSGTHFLLVSSFHKELIYKIYFLIYLYKYNFFLLLHQFFKIIISVINFTNFGIPPTKIPYHIYINFSFIKSAVKGFILSVLILTSFVVSIITSCPMFVNASVLPYQ